MKVVCIGEVLIDFVCTDQGLSLQQGQHFVKKPGGAPANVAACIGKLGGQASFVGAVGQDAFGDFLHKQLQAYNVELGALQRVDRATTLAFVSLMEDGERDFEFNRGADEQLMLSDADCNALSHEAIVHFGSATALLGGPLLKSYQRFAQLAKKAGRLISFDPNYRADLWRKDIDTFKGRCEVFFQLADIVKVSEEELLLLTDRDGLEEGCQVLHQWGVSAVLVTLGSRGCLLSDGLQCRVIPAYRITPLDTTGAGDAFIGAMLYQLAQLPADTDYLPHLPDFIAFAEKVSALVCTQIGAMTALPALTDVQHCDLVPLN